MISIYKNRTFNGIVFDQISYHQSIIFLDIEPPEIKIMKNKYKWCLQLCSPITKLKL